MKILGRKLKKNSFLEGALFGYIAILISKVLGAVYSIPFYSIIGSRGGVIYSCAYNIYSLFLDISVSGIPIAVSIVISNYNAKGMVRSKEKTYSLTLKFMAILSFICFLIMQIFARQIGMFFFNDMSSGATVEEIALGVRTIAFCLLIVPFLSLKRGYMQGHEMLAEPSASQVIEQIVRIAVVLVGSFVAINLIGLDTVYGVCVALFGATVGALLAYFYLWNKTRKNKSMFLTGGIEDEKVASSKNIAKMVFGYCLTIVIVTISNSVYNIIDMKMILVGLHNIGFSDVDTQEIASIASTWIPKICMIITALSMGITNSICPHLAKKNTMGEMKEVNNTLVQAISSFLLVSVPLVVGLITLSKPVYALFYGESAFGADILSFNSIVNVISCLVTIVGISMQSIGRGKVVCVYNIIGIIINAALDIPMIYLLNAIGYAPYVGASVASIIGFGITLLMFIISLKKAYKFKFGEVFFSLIRFIPGTICLLLAVIGLNYIWQIETTRSFLLVVQLVVYAAVGAVIYFVVTYFTGGITKVVGKEKLEEFKTKLLSKLHR